MKKEILEKVETLNEHQLNVTNEFLTNLTKETELPEIFKEKLAQLKDTPMDEPKIDAKRKEILEKQGKDFNQVDYCIEIVESVYSIEELDKICEENDVSLKDIVRFGSEIDKKVFGLTKSVDGVEVYKEIPSQMDLKPLAYSKRKEIRDISRQSRKMIEQLQQEQDMDKIGALLDEVEKLNENLMKTISSSHNLNEAIMTQWEKDLLTSKLVAHSLDNYNPPLGKK